MGALGVVLDTNVLVSALGFGGPPLDALLRAFDDDVRLVASEETLDELDRVMTYDRLPFTDADRTQYVAVLRREADVVRPEESVDLVRDSDDDKFLEAALAADAEYVVSGDRDLLDVGSYRGTDVVARVDRTGRQRKRFGLLHGRILLRRDLPLRRHYVTTEFGTERGDRATPSGARRASTAGSGTEACCRTSPTMGWSRPLKNVSATLKPDSVSEWFDAGTT